MKKKIMQDEKKKNSKVDVVPLPLVPLFNSPVSLEEDEMLAKILTELEDEEFARGLLLTPQTSTPAAPEPKLTQKRPDAW